MKALSHIICASFAIALISCSPSGEYDRIVALRDTIKANPYDVKSLAKLVGYLDDDHWLDPANAAGCFRQLAEGPENKRNIVPVIGPLVVHALVTNAENIGPASTKALAEYGIYNRPYVSQLVEILRKHPKDDMGLYAVEALGEIGPPASASLSLLRSFSYGTGNSWEEMRLEAIRRIEGREQQPTQ